MEATRPRPNEDVGLFTRPGAGTARRGKARNQPGAWFQGTQKFKASIAFGGSSQADMSDGVEEGARQWRRMMQDEVNSQI